MKFVEVKVEEKEDMFKPFSVTISIESKEELVELWHRLNMNVDAVNRLSGTRHTDRVPEITGEVQFFPFWKFSITLIICSFFNLP